jgi:hypothetical protein
MAQVAQNLSSKCEALSSNSRTAHTHTRKRHKETLILPLGIVVPGCEALLSAR